MASKLSGQTIFETGQNSKQPGISHTLGGRHYEVLGALFVLFMALLVLVVWLDNRADRNEVAYASAAGQMRMLSQEIAKSTQLTTRGNAAAFVELKKARDTFAALLDHVTEGGTIDGISVPPSSDRIQPALRALTEEWEKTGQNVTLILAQEKSLQKLGEAVGVINEKSPHFLDLSKQVAALKLQTSAPASEIAAANQLVMLTQRLVKNVNALLVAAAIDPEASSLLGRDANTKSWYTIFQLWEASPLLGKDTDVFRDALAALGGTDAQTKQKLGADFKAHEDAIAGILGNMEYLIQAKQTGSRILQDSGPLLQAATDLSDAYAAESAGRVTNIWLIGFFALLAVITLILITKAFRDESNLAQTQARLQQREAEAANDASQEAILRLMNELGDLADGDLTARATVTEDITGAIADAVNYTVEELGVLVGRINTAAGHVTAASAAAQQTSNELLAATERQSHEIRQAGDNALDMAKSMRQVSSEAMESAQVARQSLDAAQKGAEAVENSIKGMDEIRDQIQETSKRIKRLGESSQEIGEIVELISDITEQTNVLALNAAIQAASAGEAGRGFTVVAEEVQRLAERSGEATKQIAAIVKTIQTDTHNAVSAMDSSTQGVVEGAKLSDAAGQALQEISSVSTNLASLIESISATTRQQAENAARVAQNMQGILRTTEQTGAGTQQTAVSIAQLAELATELKSSVSGFKV
ncbi:MAG: methyl-accepting chemotaxis protein [Zoogloeaceae bacterium]|jgi:twitching motility protein PilJ|nr:methyl-accepting chemotaxis protein [Zoogloeaceae bacterium]